MPFLFLLHTIPCLLQKLFALLDHSFTCFMLLLIILFSFWWNSDGYIFPIVFILSAAFSHLWFLVLPSQHAAPWFWKTTTCLMLLRNWMFDCFPIFVYNSFMFILADFVLIKMPIIKKEKVLHEHNVVDMKASNPTR